MEEIEYTYRGYEVGGYFYHNATKSINYDRLDNLHQHESMRNVKRRRWYREERDRKYNSKRDLAERIFYGSVGKKLSDIQKRIEPLLIFESFNEFVSDICEDVYYNDVNKLCIKGHVSWYGSWGFYYIDANNRLQEKESTRKRFKMPQTWQQRYERKQVQRQRYKARKNEGLDLLLLINKPELFEFYKEIKQKRNDVLKQIKGARYDLNTYI